MNKELEGTFYKVVGGNDDFITADSVEQAIDDWYDGMEDNDPSPDSIDIDCYVRETISDKQVDWWLESIIEGLDENYGCEETWGDYTLSDKAQELWEAFTTQVRAEYPVAQLRRVGKITVDNPK